MNNSELANLTYEKFGNIVGNDQIATKLALRLIARHIDESNPRVILEIGSGIGTITYLLQLKSPDATVYSFEVNDWCLDQLARNVDVSRISILKTNNELLSLKEKIDFLIIDDWLDYQSTFMLIATTNPETIFVEGHRRQQRLFVLKSLKKLNLAFQLQNSRKSKDSYKGGCFINVQPSSRHRRLMDFSLVYLSLAYSKILELRSRIHVREMLNRIIRALKD